MRKGFGIIEVLIASALIATMLAGLVYIGRLTLTSGSYMSERSQALGLATEGVEIVRQIRDTNWIDNDNKTLWNSFQMNSDGTFSPIVLDHEKIYRVQFVKAQNGNSRYSLTQSANGEVIKLADNSQFTRTIIFEKVQSLIPSSPKNSIAVSDPKDTNSFKVTVTVTWGENKTISISELITNWKPSY